VPGIAVVVPSTSSPPPIGHGSYKTPAIGFGL